MENGTEDIQDESKTPLTPEMIEPPTTVELERNLSEDLNFSPVNNEISEPIDDADSQRTKKLQDFLNQFENFDLKTVRQQILDRQMKKSNLMTIFWRLFLDVLPCKMSEWSKYLDLYRDEYEELLDKFRELKETRISSNHKGLHCSNDHPLSPDAQRRFDEAIEEERLLESIKQDVNRTFPEFTFFQEESNREMLAKMLYIRAKLHKNPIPYRQGMHEILAVVVYVLENEIKSNEDLCHDSETILRKIYDRKYREHDAFAIYNVILEKVAQFYDLQINQPQKIDKKSIGLYKSGNDVLHQLNATVRRINDIFHGLKLIDHKHHEILRDFQIEPIVYGVRWVRLLFAREVHFVWISKLWLVIFCYDQSFKFVDYFFQALLVEAGNLYDNQPEKVPHVFLQILMRNNIVQDIETSIIDALDIAQKHDQLQLRTDVHSNHHSNHYSHGTDKKSDRPRYPNEHQRNSSSVQSVEAKKSAIALNRARSSNRNHHSGTEMTIDPGKETHRRHQENLQLQHRSANYIYEILSNIHTEIDTVCDQQETTDVIKLKLNGLEQIANTLSGKAPLDKTSLEHFIDFGEEHKKTKHSHR